MQPLTRHLLLIDDDPDDALFFSDALKALELPIVLDYVEGGQAALDLLQKSRSRNPDIIFLDVNMPIINGWECLREIKQIARLHETPIVMYSTADLQRQGVSPGDIGAAALLKKANSFDELKKDLQRVLCSILKLELS